MSANHRPVRKLRHHAPRPTATAAQPAAAPVLAPLPTPSDLGEPAVPSAAAVEPTPPSAAPAAAVAPATASQSQEATVDHHFQRISGLMAKAEALAEAMLGLMSIRLRQSQPVYPGELIHLCRGLHILAKCGLELRKHLKVMGKTGQPRELTAEDVDKLEARLRPLFEKRAA